MLGQAICERLAGEGKPVGALVRPSADAAKVKQLEALGVKLLPGDLRDPASLDAACSQAQQVIITASSMGGSYQPGANDMQTADLEGVRNLISFAAAAGMEHVVYTSFSGNIDSDFPLRNAKRTVEEVLEKSDMDCTILRPSCFMEVWLTPAVGFDPANGKVTIYGTGEQPISYISYQDVAEFAVQSLESPAARNATLELGGPEAVSQLEAVKIFEDVAGRKFDLQFVPVEALDAQLATAVDPMQKSFAAIMRCMADGDAIDMRETLKAFPIKLTSVKEFAAGVMAQA
jgi:NADH dehydrogenase